MGNEPSPVKTKAADKYVPSIVKAKIEARS